MARELYVATIQVLLPSADEHGTPIASDAEACDYISETFRSLGIFEDWGYLSIGGQLLSPQLKTVNNADTYEEGDFLS